MSDPNLINIEVVVNKLFFMAENQISTRGELKSEYMLTIKESMEDFSDEILHILYDLVDCKVLTEDQADYLTNLWKKSESGTLIRMLREIDNVQWYYLKEFKMKIGDMFRSILIESSKNGILDEKRKSEFIKKFSLLKSDYYIKDEEEISK